MDVAVEELSFRIVVSEKKGKIRWRAATAHLITFDRPKYPALIRLHLNERSAIVVERRNSHDCKGRTGGD
jgi:hypothetical protein